MNATAPEVSPSITLDPPDAAQIGAGLYRLGAVAYRALAALLNHHGPDGMPLAEFARAVWGERRAVCTSTVRTGVFRLNVVLRAAGYPRLVVIDRGRVLWC